MKKKLLSLIAVSAALATAGSALVACGGDDNGNGGANASVTKEQWSAALSLSSFESNFKADVRIINEQEKMMQDVVFVAGAKKYGDYSVTRTRLSLEGKKLDERVYVRVVGADKESQYTRYSGLADNAGVDGEWEDGEWSVEYDDVHTYTDEQWISCIDDTGIQYTFKFADQYDKFEYKNGTYVLKGKDGIVIDEDASDPESDSSYKYSYTVTATDIVVKFVDGKLASVNLVMTQHFVETYDGETETSDITFRANFKISYGTQKIEEPEDAVEWMPPTPSED